jgi:hypothetical protein
MASSTTNCCASGKLPRLQYLNAQIDLANQNVLQQQHVDWKISNALLKKGTRDAYKTWNQQDRAWVDMRLHESHDAGGFGVSNNTITRHAASYTTNARFVAFLGTFARPAQQVWLPGNDLQDPSSWVAPPLCTLKRLHGDLLQQYDCTEQLAVAQPALPSDAGGGAAAHAGAHPQPHAGSQDNGNGKLSYRDSTAFIWHSCGVRCPPRRLPPLRTSSPSISRSPSSLPSAVSRSNSLRIGRPSRSCVSATVARASRNSASFTSLRSTRPQSRTPPCAWR